MFLAGRVPFVLEVFRFRLKLLEETPKKSKHQSKLRVQSQKAQPET